MLQEKVSDKHKELFHYTTYEGFKGIMETQTLWAKHFRHLNDSTEVVYIREKMHEIIVPLIKNLIKKEREKFKPAIKEYGGRDGLAKHQANGILKALFETAFGSDVKPAMFPPFILSFCSHLGDGTYEPDNGLLSMWRGYGADGGIALVFDTKKLEGCLEQEACEYAYSFGVIGNVVYEGDDEFFMEEFSDFIELFKAKVLLLLTCPGDDFSLGEDFLKSFFSASTRYKHMAFKEEREVRGVASPWGDEDFKRADEKEIGKRKKKITFHEAEAEFISLFDGESVPRLPITRVIIGPHQEQEKRYQEVQALLRKRKDIEVCCSLTPYIPGIR